MLLVEEGSSTPFRLMLGVAIFLWPLPPEVAPHLPRGSLEGEGDSQVPHPPPPAQTIHITSSPSTAITPTGRIMATLHQMWVERVKAAAAVEEGLVSIPTTVRLTCRRRPHHPWQHPHPHHFSAAGKETNSTLDKAETKIVITYLILD